MFEEEVGIVAIKKPKRKALVYLLGTWYPVNKWELLNTGVAVSLKFRTDHLFGIAPPGEWMFE